MTNEVTGVAAARSGRPRSGSGGDTRGGIDGEGPVRQSRSGDGSDRGGGGGDVIIGTDGRGRCRWGASDEEYRRYHDEEWGTVLHGDRALFEKLSLEGFQAGLSWITILRRREEFRRAFAGFEPSAVASFTDDDVESLMLDASIIRNRAKILATIGNARVTLDLIRSEPGGLDRLLWSFAPPRRAHPPRGLADVPAVTAESTAMSKALRALGYRFVGPTTSYALMQSSGMVDDHLDGCWRSAWRPHSA